jgi:hypothetical protein
MYVNWQAAGQAYTSLLNSDLAAAAVKAAFMALTAAVKASTRAKRIPPVTRADGIAVLGGVPHAVCSSASHACCVAALSFAVLLHDARCLMLQRVDRLVCCCCSLCGQTVLSDE